MVQRVGPVAGAVLGGVALWLSACGLSQQGLGEETSDGGPTTGVVDATSRDGASSADGSTVTDARGAPDQAADGAPSPCATLDASCLGPVPAGWQPVGVTDGGCAPGFTAQTLVTNARLDDGGCACGACQVLGAFTCTSSVDISGGDQCGDPTLVTVTPGTCTRATAQHVEAHAPAATGTPGCTASSDAGTGVVTDPLTMCLPSCAADYCGSASHCIVASGDVACPQGFALLAHAGSGADPGCAPCGCSVDPPGPCQGTVTVFDSPTCADSGASATYAVDTCHQYSTSSDYQAVLVQLVPPTPSCAPSTVTGDTGDASLTGARTICCQ